MSSRKRAVSRSASSVQSSPSRSGALQQRVVDVGDVLDVVNLPLGVEPHALHEVERVVGRRVTHVGRVVRSDAADVDTGDGTGVEGDRTAGRGVVDPEVAALARQGGDLRSGPGMHAMSLTGRPFRIRTGPAPVGRIGALATPGAMLPTSACGDGRRLRPAARGSPATAPLGPRMPARCRSSGATRAAERLQLRRGDQFAPAGRRAGRPSASSAASRRSTASASVGAAARPPSPTAACAACPPR